MTITAAQFRKGAMTTWAVKPGKNGLRQMLRKNLTTNVGHAMVGIGTEASEVLHAAGGYLLGVVSLHDPDQREAVLDETSDLVYYLTVAAKFLKIKLPSIVRRRKPDGTPSAKLLEINHLGNRCLSKYKKLYYGQEMDLHALTELVTALIEATWDFIWMFLDVPVAEVMAYNNAKLLTGPNARYKDGKFTVEAIEAKDKADAAAAKKTTEVKPTASKAPAKKTTAKKTAK